MENTFALRGDICHSDGPKRIDARANSYLICENGVSAGIFDTLPERYRGISIIDCKDRLIVPGLVDLHMHAPQYAFRGMGMDLQLLEWLETRTFPEEAKYADAEYAEKAYGVLVNDLKNGPNTRFCVYATIHLPATVMLMDMFEASGLAAMVGKVNMDRNCPPALREADAATSLADTGRWLDAILGRYAVTRPVLTPRFIPSCSDGLLRGLANVARERDLPVQSHLSENPDEVAWVAELCPDSEGYGDAYLRAGLFGGDVPTVMAHCVWCGDDELLLMRRQGVFVAHCPQSNANLSSGIAPARRFLDWDLRVGLGSDMAGGCHSSIFRAMADAIQVSKLRWRLYDPDAAPLTLEEAFWMGTAGGGAFFGKVGAFDSGYEFDAVVLDDGPLRPPFDASIPERLARVVHLSDDRHVAMKYVLGVRVK